MYKNNKIAKVFLILLIVCMLFIFGCKSEEKTYTLTYILNGDEYTSCVVKENEIIELETIEETGGVVFFGWCVDSEYSALFEENTINKDTTLYGFYISPYYRVSFVTNCDTEIESKIVHKGDKLYAIPTLEKSGYDFIGWYRDEGFKSLFDFDSTISGTLTLYAKWQEKEPEKVILNFVSITEDAWASKDDLYVSFYSYFYDFLLNHTDCDMSSITLDDFLTLGKTWTIKNRSDMYHFGDKFGKYYVTSMGGGTLEEQPEDTFLGYCYKNNKFVSFIHHLETFFEYWRTDEGYTGSESDPNNVGNDFYIEPWASMVDTAKFFYFTSETLNTKYSWFNSERVKDALDNIPNVLNSLQGNNLLKYKELDLNAINVEGANIEYYLDKDGNNKINKLDSSNVNFEEVSSLTIYVKIIFIK